MYRDMEEHSQLTQIRTKHTGFGKLFGKSLFNRKCILFAGWLKTDL
jgi:hypothetical protein